MKWTKIEGVGREHYVSSIDKHGDIVVELSRVPDTNKWSVAVHAFAGHIPCYADSVELPAQESSAREALIQLMPGIERYFRDQLSDLREAIDHVRAEACREM